MHHLILPCHENIPFLICYFKTEIILKVLFTFITDYVFDNLILTDFILQMMWLSLCSDGLKQLLSKCS